MFVTLRADYERFKAASFSIRLLRFSTTMYATFFFWNLVLQPDSVTGLSKAAGEKPFIFALTILIGIVFSVICVLRLPNLAHLMMLPLAALGFALTSFRDPLHAIFLVPLVAALVLLLVQAIVKTSNFINRL